MIIYLAGAMENAINLGVKWRRSFNRELGKIGIKCIIPNDEEDNIKKDANLKELKKTNINEYIKIMREFIKLDLGFVEKADAIVCYWDGSPTAGTIHEVGFAYQLNKPTYLVSEIDDIDIPGWFLACFTERFYSLKHLVKFLGEKNESKDL